MRTTTPSVATRAPQQARPVHSISSLPVSRREDQQTRIRNYLISMGIRTASFALAGFFAIATDWTVAAWVCVAAAALLPYPAVVFANNVDRRRGTIEPVSPLRALDNRRQDAISGTVLDDDQ